MPDGSGTWLWQCPASPGRQLVQEELSLTQAQRMHLAVPLHRQHRREREVG